MKNYENILNRKARNFQIQCPTNYFKLFELKTHSGPERLPGFMSCQSIETFFL